MFQPVDICNLVCNIWHCKSVGKMADDSEKTAQKRVWSMWRAVTGGGPGHILSAKEPALKASQQEQ